MEMGFNIDVTLVVCGYRDQLLVVFSVIQFSVAFTSFCGRVFKFI